MTRKEKTSFLVCLGLTLAVGGLLTVGNIIFGPLNHDEGWYIYSALQIAEGRYPFIDFAFTQAPLLPLVYSLAQPIFESCGLLGARILTAVIAWLSAFVWASLAARVTPRACRRWAFLLTLILLLLNSYHSYFTVIPKTYALTLLLFGLFAHTLERSLTRASWSWALITGLLAGLCFCTRVSCLPLLLVPPVMFLLRDRDLRSPQAWSFCAGAGVVLFCLLGPFFMAEPDNTWFGLVSFHGLRDPGTLAQLFLFKVGFLARLAQGYALICFLTLIVFVISMVKTSEPPSFESENLFLLGLEAIVALMTLIQFFAPFPYDDYQVIVMPGVAVWLVLVLLRRYFLEERYRSHLPTCTWCLLALSLVLVAGSPVHQDWMISGRDRIWWNVKAQSDLVQLQKAADLLPDDVRGDLLLTQDLYLAVEAGMRVPEGLEMGPFAFYPAWTTEEAASHHVMNTERFVEAIESEKAEWAAISGYSFAIESPDIQRVEDEVYARLMIALETHYEPVHRVPNFGQGATELILYRLKLDPAE